MDSAIEGGDFMGVVLLFGAAEIWLNRMFCWLCWCEVESGWMGRTSGDFDGGFFCVRDVVVVSGSGEWRVIWVGRLLVDWFQRVVAWGGNEINLV